MKVKQGIGGGSFDGAARMACPDAVFANRWVQACHARHAGQGPTRAWVRAFDATRAWRRAVLQHLLPCMNAHVVLDLGIAAAQTVTPQQPQGLRGDFDKINRAPSGSGLCRMKRHASGRSSGR